MYSIQLDEYKPESSHSPSPSNTASQGRKSDRACDFCRRRKTRCDGAPTPGSKCTNCKRNQCPCTYMEASRPRGPPKAYVTALEDRIERFERLFKRLRPEADFSDIIGPSIPRGAWRNDRDPSGSEGHPDSNRALGGASDKNTASSSTTLLPKPSIPTGGEDAYDESSDDDETFLFPRIEKRAETESPTESPKTNSPSLSSNNVLGFGDGFHGKSSFLPIISVTRRYMRSAMGHETLNSNADEVGEDWRAGLCELPRTRRQMYWTVAPWEEAWERRRSTFAPTAHQDAKASAQIFDFPPLDLVLPLLSLYFHHTNTMFPLLHGPIFYAHLHDGLHTRDPRFASVVWACMAIASRWSPDPRVLWDGWGSPGTAKCEEKVKREGDEEEWAGAGWRFFLRSLDGSSFTVTSLDPPNLFDIQFCCLGATFLRGSSLGPAGWIAVGTGLRKAMDVGAHRKKVYKSTPNADDELWKRAFWILVLFDRLGSVALGRPCCVREEDFDLDYPLEVDDEFWSPTDPSLTRFAQPAGRPSSISYFVSMIKLFAIKAHVLRTLYCIDKSKVLLGLVSEDWQEQVVSQLNAALDDWVESVPQHLHWADNIESEIFSNQSATLYTSYYLCLINVYRPFAAAAAFIPQNTQDPSPSSIPVMPSRSFPFPADSIVASAAQSAIRIIEVQMAKGLSNIPVMLAVAQVAATARLMGLHAIMSGASGPQSVKARMKERENVLADVDKCIHCLELVESRWIMARKFLSMIRASLPDPNEPVVFAPKPKPTQARVSSQSKVAASRPQIQVGSSIPAVLSHQSDQSCTTSTPLPSNVSSGASYTPQMSEGELALTNHANWRWFNDPERAALCNSYSYGQPKNQEQIGRQARLAGPGHGQLFPLRHHAVVPAMRSTSSVSPAHQQHSYSPAPPHVPSIPSHLHHVPQRTPHNASYAPHSETGRRLSVPLTIPSETFDGIHDFEAQQPRPISATVRSSGSPASSHPPGSAGFFGAPQSAAREEYGAHMRGSHAPHDQGQSWDCGHGQRIRVPSQPYAVVQSQSHESPYGASRYS